MLSLELLVSSVDVSQGVFLPLSAAWMSQVPQKNAEKGREQKGSSFQTHSFIKFSC